MLHPIRTCAGLAAAVLMLLCALALVPRLYAPLPPLQWVAALTPWLLAPTILALLLGLLGRAWVVVTITAVLLGVQVWWQAPLYLPDARTSSSPAVVVMTSNLKYGSADPAVVVDTVRDRHVDVLATQELTDSAVTALTDAGIDKLMPYHYLAPTDDFRGTGIWSRTPLTHTRVLEGFVSRQLFATLTVDGTRITFASVHPIAPTFTSSATWSDEQAALGAAAADVKGPLLMAGDFNATRDQSPFRDLLTTGGFTDAVDQAGAGLSFTFSTERLPRPVVTIDHQLVKDLPWVATGVTTTDIQGSDHRAVIVTYARTR